ncbi:hypothetical protein M407DRAFT_241188 [Tulasnella calospora MUT 4182]|uniref:Uncharacterized protein n=1 Tax=Tulasnella calospora MUT 4182 TaxID=1051891 RepID=A0A0C3QKB6_9AGAM|nr:hypothetical protein M407DRAFT_241188 [Tulasnella calospora MUT 4182]
MLYSSKHPDVHLRQGPSIASRDQSRELSDFSLDLAPCCSPVLSRHAVEPPSRMNTT